VAQASLKRDLALRKGGMALTPTEQDADASEMRGEAMI
jgi:hypothetical protein